MTWPADYGEFVGLWLNVPRCRFQWAAMTLAGVAAAGNNESLEEIWFDGLARWPEEAVELQDGVNRERATKKVLATMGRR